jgi:hypothetical protein
VTPLGTDGHTVIIRACHGISVGMAGSMEVAVVDPKCAKTTPDGGGINIENIIGVQIGAHAYGLGAPQLVHDAYFPRPLVCPTMIGGTHPGMSENVKEQVARTLRESLVYCLRGGSGPTKSLTQTSLTPCHI